MAPISGLTIPRVELNVLVLESRLTLSTARALNVDNSLHPVQIKRLSDSECTIAELDKSSSKLKPYFHNRVLEILENLIEMEKIALVDEVYHVPGNLNVANLGTHPKCTIDHLGPGTTWQCGLLFSVSQGTRGLWHGPQ